LLSAPHTHVHADNECRRLISARMYSPRVEVGSCKIGTNPKGPDYIEYRGNAQY
jgi:hypothetical protein